MKKPYNVVSFSGGKDSTAMLLRMIELDMPIDEIIFCDTTVEFPKMYEHIKRVEEYINRPITRLTPKYDYEYYLLKKEVFHTRGIHKGEITKGYGFTFFTSRWCTRIFKSVPIKKYLCDISVDREIIEYIGIAADEPKRIHEKNYPLVEWGWTEKDCLEYCYSKGFDWNGLYKHFKRLSCWCCPLQRIHSWRKLRKIHPELWAKLLGWEDEKMKENPLQKLTSKFSAHELDARFAAEDRQLSLF